jgi:hypothetical protein
MNFLPSARLLVAAGLACSFMGVSASAEQVFSKDAGPVQASCDGHAKGSAGWQACVGAARADMSDDELFYAGYWLAKSGRYADALIYLNLTRVKDERVLTYIGFATRKQGDVDKLHSTGTPTSSWRALISAKRISRRARRTAPVLSFQRSHTVAVRRVPLISIWIATLPPMPQRTAEVLLTFQEQQSSPALGRGFCLQ